MTVTYLKIYPTDLQNKWMTYNDLKSLNVNENVGTFMEIT